MYTLQVTIDQSHIKSGIYCGLVDFYSMQDEDEFVQQNCPAALALNEIFNNVRVMPSVVMVEEIQIPSPQELEYFIDSFDSKTACSTTQEAIDAKEQMEGITFELPIPDELIEKININKVKQIIETSNHLNLV